MARNTMLNAAERKELISELKFLEKERKKLKSKKVIDLWAWADIKEAIRTIKEKLNMKK